MKVILFLRKSPDWNSVKIRDCRQENTKYPGDQVHIPLVKEWNNLFGVRWQTFRSKLKSFTINSWPLDHIQDFRLIPEMDDEDIIVPIDDDDWVSPDIEDFIRSEMGNNDVLRWTQIVNSYADKRLLYKWNRNGCSTSDHAIKCHVLKNLDKGTRSRVLYGHGHVLQHLADKRRLFVPESKSCYNHHIGSHSLLCRFNSIRDLLDRAIKLDYCPSWALWAKPMIEWLDDEILRVVNHKSKAVLKYL